MTLVFKQEALNGIIYGHYMEGLTSGKSYEKLIKIVGHQAMTLGEVSQQFRRIKTKEYTLTEGPPNQSPITLAHLFGNHVISPYIFKHFDLADRLILRKVSHFYRNCVKNQKFEINHLQMLGYGEKIVADLFNVLYLNYGCGFLTGRHGRFKSVDGYRDECVIRDAKAILDNKDLTIRHLDINFSLASFKENLPRFDDKIRLKVHRLTISVEDSYQIRYALSFMNHNHIRELKVNCRDKDRLNVIDVVALFKLQWKSLNVLVTPMRFCTKRFVEFFGHFDYCFFVVQNTRIGLGVLENLKDTLLLRQSVRKFNIIPSFNHYPKDPLFLIPPRSFRPFQDPTNPNKFMFPYPDSNQILTCEISYDGVIFTGPAYTMDRHEVINEQRRMGPRENVVEEESMYASEPYDYINGRTPY